MTSYLPRFDAEFAPKLTKRAKTFRLMFEMLEEQIENGRFPTIIETGTIRELGCWDGDGCSTAVFCDFCSTHHQAEIITVDINPNSINLALKELDPISIHQGDSVAFLHGFEQPIDLLYLDSFDFDPANPHPSSLHHLKELAAAQKNLRPGSIICVDDNHPNGTGKGAYVRDYLHNIGIEPIADDYQVVWVWK